MVLAESRDSGRREPSPGTRPASVCPVVKPGLSIWLLLFQGPVALLVVFLLHGFRVLRLCPLVTSLVSFYLSLSLGSRFYCHPCFTARRQIKLGDLPKVIQKVKARCQRCFLP